MYRYLHLSYSKQLQATTHSVSNILQVEGFNNIDASKQAAACSNVRYLEMLNVTNNLNLEILGWYNSKNQNTDQCLDKVFRMWFQWNIMVSGSAHSWEKRLETCFWTIRMFHLLSWITRNKVRDGFWDGTCHNWTINIH